jgi:Protein of unknown function (DUF2795)
MNFDPGQAKQLLDHVPYPVGKDKLVQLAQQHNMNPQVMAVLNRLPDKTYNSSDDVQKELQNVQGNLGNLGGGFKL